jgi:hypothetical protein
LPGKAIPNKTEVIGLPEFDFVLKVKEHCDNVPNVTNEMNKGLHHGKQEVEDNATQNDGSHLYELNPEDENYDALLELFGSQQGRDLGLLVEQDFGSSLLSVAPREAARQAQPHQNPIWFPGWLFDDMALSHEVDSDKHWRYVQECEGQGQVARSLRIHGTDYPT